MPRPILLIEIQNSLRQNLSQHLRQEGYDVFIAGKKKEVVSLLSKKKFEVAILGLEGLKFDGLAILRMLRQRFPALKVLTINTAERFDFSLECMRLGAYDDFLIPFDLDALMESLSEAFGVGSEQPSAWKSEQNEL